MPDQQRHDSMNSSTHIAVPTRLIEVGFEIRLVMKVGITLALSMVLAITLFYLLIPRHASGTYLETFLALNEMRLSLLRLTVFSTAAQILLAGLLIAGVALFASHKIAGPLVRFEHCLRQLSEGNLQQTIFFRRGDQDQPLIAAFQELCQRLRLRIIAANEATDNLCQLRDDLLTLSTAESLTSVKATEIARRIRAEADKLKKAGTFLVEPNGHQ